jgi:ABC-type branched-subunit amino acid transport system ATPase component/ABC-type branched-subunit amino acid transport system permease subunit
MTSGTLVLGLINGLSIGLLAVGFVLVYRGNRFLNLAQAQLGALSAMILAKVVNDWHWGWWPSFVACIGVGVLTGVVVERFIVSVVRRRSKAPVRLLMVTIGVADLLLALTYIPALTPKSQAPFPQPFDSHLEIGGVVLSGMSVLTVISVPVLLVALTVFLEFTTVGKQVRAAASNPDAARLCGISVDRVSLIIWGVAGALSAVSAVFNGPTTASYNVEAAGPYLLMLTMGAAAVGAFVSIPAAVAGGVTLGLVYQVVSAETNNAGTAELAVFGAILVIVFLRGTAIARAYTFEGAAVPDLRGIRVPASLRRSREVRWGPKVMLALALTVAVIFPHLPFFSHPGNQFLLVLVLIYALVGVGLTVLVGWAGQVSLGSVALVGIGAFLTARWAGHAGWNLLDIIVVTGFAGAAVSTVIGLPALRVRGVTLAVVTLGFAVIAPDWLFQTHWFAGPTPTTTVVNPVEVLPGIGHLNSQADMYYAVLVAVILSVVAARFLRQSSPGRTIIAVRDNERASSAFGIRPGRVKLSVFAVSGFLAAVAGVFWALTWQNISAAQFPADASIAVLALPVVGGIGSVGGTVAAAVMIYMGTFFVGPHVSGLFGSLGQNAGFLLLLGGLGIVGSMIGYPNGLAGAAQDWWQRRLYRRAEPDAAPVVPASEEGPGARPWETRPLELIPAPRHGPPGPAELAPLEASGVVVRFGGIRALDGAAITVGRHEIIGLIGPNGSGKTTLMNAISGIIRPAQGSIRLFGTEVAGAPAELRAHLGVARSFQEATLFPGLTVIETVMVALRTNEGAAAASWWRLGDGGRRARAMEIVTAFGLEAWADSLTVELSTGMRRICDLMAQVAAGPRLLLLDEPTAGVAQREAESFGPLVRRISQDLGCSVLIVEHDMPLLMGLCDRVYALEAGRVIAAGRPDQVRNDPVVIASYLGTDAAATQRSGAARPIPSPAIPSKQGGQS